MTRCGDTWTDEESPAQTDEANGPGGSLCISVSRRGWGFLLMSNTAFCSPWYLMRHTAATTAGCCSSLARCSQKHEQVSWFHGHGWVTSLMDVSGQLQTNRSPRIS